MSFMEMKHLSHLMKLLHLMTLTSQQFCLCDILFNVHDTLIKHALRPTLVLYACATRFNVMRNLEKFLNSEVTKALFSSEK